MSTRDIVTAIPDTLASLVMKVRYSDCINNQGRTYTVSADIDECMGDHGCDQTCVNTPGSYSCNCERGFQLINSTKCDGMHRIQ